MEVIALLRDLALIILALLNIVLLSVVLVLVLQILRLVRLLQRQVPPLLDSANRGLLSLRGTIDFLGDLLVRPAIRMVALGLAIGRFLSVLLGRQGGP